MRVLLWPPLPLRHASFPWLRVPCGAVRIATWPSTKATVHETLELAWPATRGSRRASNERGGDAGGDEWGGVERAAPCIRSRSSALASSP